jgi:hypothetical protein
MGNEKEILVIGNKPYLNINLSNVIDSFEENYRCNLSVQNNNNGTKVDKLALCNHLYDSIGGNVISLSSFISKYTHAYKMEEMIEFYNNFIKNKSFFNEIYYAQPNADKYNLHLKKIKCPYIFTKQPRTGYAVIMELLIDGSFPFVTHFSFYDEKRKSYCTKDSSIESKFHEKKDEINIFSWLHRNGFIDASLCLLDDKKDITFKEEGSFVSDVIKEKIKLYI